MPRPPLTSASHQPASPEVEARQRRSGRLWRIAFVVYGSALVTATHWPNLQLSPASPASDKTIHVVAFGCLAILLSQTDWIRSLLWLGATCIAWAGIDEISQGLPGLHRTVSALDFLADIAGVLIALALLALMRGAGLMRQMRAH